jgi:hypothetical protein
MRKGKIIMHVGKLAYSETVNIIDAGETEVTTDKRWVPDGKTEVENARFSVKTGKCVNDATRNGTVYSTIELLPL